MGCFGGSSSQQNTIAGSQTTLANTMAQNYNSLYGQQQGTFGKLGSILQNVQNGKLLPGFDAATMAALNTGALDATAANYRNSLQAVQGQNAGRGGGSPGTTSGILTQEQIATANAGAGELSNEQLKIQLANEAQATQNTNTAIGGYNALAGLQNPAGTGGLAEKGLSDAFSSASTINELNNQEMSNMINFGTNLGMKALSGGASLGAGESLGEGLGDFAGGFANG